MLEWSWSLFLIGMEAAQRAYTEAGVTDYKPISDCMNSAAIAQNQNRCN
jgi:hypothetical protein